MCARLPRLLATGLQDFSSYAYVDRWTAPRLTANGAGVFLRFSGGAPDAATPAALLDPPTTTPDELQRGVNYLLNVNNATFVPSLVRYGGIATPRQFLLLLTSNITWGRHPALEALPGACGCWGVVRCLRGRVMDK